MSIQSSAAQPTEQTEEMESTFGNTEGEAS